MTDESIRSASSDSGEKIQRFLLLGRLAGVMEKMIDGRLADPDTETHEIITEVTASSSNTEEDSRLDPKNLGPVLDAMKRHGSRS